MVYGQTNCFTKSCKLTRQIKRGPHLYAATTSPGDICGIDFLFAKKAIKRTVTNGERVMRTTKCASILIKSIILLLIISPFANASN